MSNREQHHQQTGVVSLEIMTLKQLRHALNIATRGAGFTRLDGLINQWLSTTGVLEGAVHLTCLHTSASLTINENADPRVLRDLADWMQRIVPRDHPYSHDDEGPDDMPAHIRTALTAQTMTLSLSKGLLLLGTWQAVYLWEHRDAPHLRTIHCQLIGEWEEPVDRLKDKSNTTVLLNRRRGSRLNQAIQERHNPEAWATDGGVDTDVDLLVDRLHELADD